MHFAHTRLCCDIACNILSVVHRRLLRHQSLRAIKTTSHGGRSAGARAPRNIWSKVEQITKRSYIICTYVLYILILEGSAGYKNKCCVCMCAKLMFHICIAPCSCTMVHSPQLTRIGVAMVAHVPCMSYAGTLLHALLWSARQWMLSWPPRTSECHCCKLCTMP